MTDRPDMERPPIARRVVTGLGPDGRSTITEDGEIPLWVRRPIGSVIMDIWRTDTLPASTEADSSAGDELVLAPSPGGLCVRLAVFPPDRSVDPEKAAAYERSLGEVYGDQGATSADNAARVPGSHRTDTIDVAVVVEGEIWVVMEDGETLLKAGDSLVQRGTMHAWQNRSNRPCTLASVMYAADRAATSD